MNGNYYLFTNLLSDEETRIITDIIGHIERGDGAVEPYPNRWTHHTIVSEPDQLDGELMGWLREAHAFALVKEGVR